MNNLTVILVFLVTVTLFFWGVYRAIKTQRVIYMLAMVPFFMVMIGMFFL